MLFITCKQYGPFPKDSRNSDPVPLNNQCMHFSIDTSM